MCSCSCACACSGPCAYSGDDDISLSAGVALTAILSRVLFQEPLTRVMSLGIALILGGVLLIELGAAH